MKSSNLMPTVETISSLAAADVRLPLGRETFRVRERKILRGTSVKARNEFSKDEINEGQNKKERDKRGQKSENQNRERKLVYENAQHHI